VPEEEVRDTSKDLDSHIIALCSPVDKQELDEEALEIQPQVLLQQVLRLLQSIKLGEMQLDNYNAEYIRWIKRYKKVVQQRHLKGLKQVNIQSFFILTGTPDGPST